MPIVFRGILLDAASGMPVIGNANGDQLGVRPADVTTYLNNGVPWVAPTNAGAPQGASVAPGNGCNLPRHRRPSNTTWNGTNNKAALRVWQVNTALFPVNELAYAADPHNPAHGFISPAGMMPLADFQGYVQSTANLWTVVAPPVPACANMAGAGVDGEERAALIDATASGGDVESLVAELRAANAAGTSRSDLIAELTSGVERATDDDAAEVLRDVLDRVTGFCGPHARIDLEE